MYAQKKQNNDRLPHNEEYNTKTGTGSLQIMSIAKSSMKRVENEYEKNMVKRVLYVGCHIAKTQLKMELFGNYQSITFLGTKTTDVMDTNSLSFLCVCIATGCFTPIRGNHVSNIC